MAGQRHRRPRLALVARSEVTQVGDEHRGAIQPLAHDARHEGHGDQPGLETLPGRDDLDGFFAARLIKSNEKLKMQNAK